MIVSNKPITLVFLVIFLSKATLHICDAYTKSNNSILCIESEKQALLSFKKDLEDPYGRLQSWATEEEEDCCQWAGIVCNNITGHVQELQISNLKGKLNPSLLNLKNLDHLDLSNNDFGGIPIPSFIGSLARLRYLNLARAGFRGMIPHQLGSISTLRYLKLGGDSYELYAKNFHWISSLSSLEYLEIRNANCSEASDHWLLAINKLPTLLELHLSSCQLGHIHPLFYPNFTSLTTLDISGNNFNSVIPGWVFSLARLTDLDLSGSEFIGSFPNGSWSLPSLKSLRASENYLNSTIPSYFYGFTSIEDLDLSEVNLQGVLSNAIENLTSLVSLDLRDNALEGKLPTTMGNLCNLETLGLSYNRLNGEVFENLLGCLPNKLKYLSLSDNLFSSQIADEIGNFSSLVSLDMDHNMISGPLPMSIGNVSSLVGLYMGYNMISGPLPMSIGKLSALQNLYISGNQLNGSLPESLGSLSNLDQLYISDNLFEGVVSEIHFCNLTNLRYFIASGNSLSLRVSSDWIPPFHLSTLELGSWDLGHTQFPTWLKSQDGIHEIDLSNTGISEAVPSWFWNLSSNFYYINLCDNKIYGELPSMLPVDSASILYLCSNKFKGPIPRTSLGVFELDLSNNDLSGDISDSLCHPIGNSKTLHLLRLGGNHLSGNIPDCWMHYPSLVVIDLANNNLSGEIPSSMGSLQNLLALHLRNNSLSGEISSFLQNCADLTLLDLGLNKFVGNIPKWIGVSLSNLVVLGVRSNKLNGSIPLELCRLTQLQIFDAAYNNLSGVIPRCFNNFSSMVTRNHSSDPFSYSYTVNKLIESAFVVTKGREDEYNTILSLVTSIDFSCNNLSGEIPKQLTSLQGLETLNLSRNHLKGSIPDNVGNMQWLESLDVSRNQLSGKIPPSISLLNFLSYLDVSYNNLSGEIPSSTQLQSFNASSFIGNQLCGPPFTKSCRTDQNKANSGTESTGGRLNDEGDWFRLGVATGFAVGFLGVIAPLLSYKPWRRAYFYFWENYMWFKIVGCYIRLKNIVHL